jgi:hypothetical protein
MTPASYPLTLYRGDTYRWAFTFFADAAMTVPADLTGVTVAAEIRDRPGGSAITALACAQTSNVITVALSSAACQGLPTSGCWDLQLTYLSGDVATVLAGSVTVTPDVTGSTVATAGLTPQLRRVS